MLLTFSVTVALNLIAMALLLSPSLSHVYQGMLTVPNIALQNAMACRVFRLLKYGVTRCDPQSLSSETNHHQLTTFQNPFPQSNLSESLAGGDLTGDIPLYDISSIEVARDEEAQDTTDSLHYKEMPLYAL